MNKNIIKDLNQHKDLLEMIVLAAQHWIKHFFETDTFILKNGIIFLDMLSTSYVFCSLFKDHWCTQILLDLSRQPNLPENVRKSCLSLASALTSTLSTEPLSSYTKARFNNTIGEDEADAKLLNKVYKSVPKTL